MTLAKAIPLAIALAAGAAAVCGAGSFMPAAAAPETPGVSEADMTYFYKNPSPERVAELIAYFDTLTQTGDPHAQPAIVGFLAAAFEKYPRDIDRMIPRGLSATTQGMIAASLRLAGQDSKARSLANHLKASGAAAPDLRDVPASLNDVAATGPKEFDLLWGASFASGDPRYTLKILDRFAAVANVDGNADDMVAVARHYGTDSDMRWIVKKRGADKAGELIAQSTALWGLYSNSLQHEFVRAALIKYIAVNPEAQASKALLAMAQQYGHYDIKKVVSVTETAPGKHSVTVNLSYLNQVLDDLLQHAGSYPVHFLFPDERQRAEHDVAQISAVLDPLSQELSRNPRLQLRLGLLHAVGFNLDIPGSHDKAIAAFSAVVELTPNDPQANYQYGAFLAATTRKGEGIPYLEKAKGLGVAGADYWLGWSYEAVGQKTQAIENFESYTNRVPSDGNAARVLDAVRHDKVNFQERKTVP